MTAKQLEKIILTWLNCHIKFNMSYTGKVIFHFNNGKLTRPEIDYCPKEDST